jgi:UDP-N-acetyl-D-mannosaminuronate dehydrogenase
VSAYRFTRDVAVIGGCGRVGLPFGIAFASRGLAVTLVDLNESEVASVNAGRMPFGTTRVVRVEVTIQRPARPWSRLTQWSASVVEAR